MLRISHDRVTSKEVRLVVEGHLQGPWVAELQKTCAPFVGNGRRLTLDLSQVLFADGGGVALMKTLRERGAALECSPFLTELLGGDCAQAPEAGQGGGDDPAGTERS